MSNFYNLKQSTLPQCLKETENAAIYVTAFEMQCTLLVVHAQCCSLSSFVLHPRCK